jgi:hypothetical protein
MDTAGKVTLHGLFDKILVPRTPVQEKNLFVYYKVVVDEPCIISLRVTGPRGSEITGDWRDSVTGVGLMQATWMLKSSRFREPGRYEFELTQESEGSEPHVLAQMRLTVEETDG